MRHYSSFPLVGALACLAAGLTGCDTNPLAPAREPPAALFARGGSKSPSNTSARPENSSGVEITWTDNSSNEDGFHVERSTNGGVSWTTVYRTDPNQTRTSDNSGNEDGFRIERSTDEGASWVSAGTTAKNERSFADSGRTVEQRTCYRVVAFNGKGDSAPSSTDCTSTTPGPTDLIATLVGPLTIDLVWTDNSGSEDGYVVERIYFPQEDWFVVAELPPNSTSHRDTVPYPWTTYWYRVRAKKDGGYSDFSNEAWAQTPP
jgi:hypothetical protein